LEGRKEEREEFSLFIIVLGWTQGGEEGTLIKKKLSLRD